MRKVIPSTIMVLVLTGAIVLLFSSCSYFAKQDFGIANSREFAKQVVFKKIETSPVDAESHYAMGCHFQKQKKHEWAIEEFQAAVQENSAYVEAYNRLGVSYDLTGDFDQALAAYNAALRINPDLDYVHNNLGYSYLLQGKYDLAVSSFQRAISLNPEKERYHNNLASAYAKSGQEDAAMSVFKADSDDAKANLTMARIYYRDGEYQKAEAYFAKADRLKPNDDHTQKGLAAATNLAGIRNSRDTIHQEARQETVVEASTIVSNRYDEDGFYTIPAVPVQDFGSDEIVAVDITPSNPVAENTAMDQLYTIAALTPAVNSSSEKEVVQEKLEATMPKLMDEMEVRDLLGDDSKPGSKKHLKIEVSNGNGVRRMAKKVGHYLNGKGFTLMYLSNADRFNYGKSRITYTRGNLDEAYRMSQAIPGLQSLEEVAAIRQGNAEISILLGKDLEEYVALFEEE